ncbi:endolytic transglycosylase MltG [Pseudactinotalea sp. HY160]|uniref:endolytic transglycosylase MltG n=1 Tax=Pseudactinotalea sp. HY160 TaxID=2654490 RepID=UPI00128DED03|nr:endolytic transglycosylase MltG [Pseudactinotalea sp. HY160]
MTDLFHEPAGDEAPAPPSRSHRRAAARRRNQRRKNVVSFLVMVLALVLLVGGAVVFIRPLLTHTPPESNDFPGPGQGSVEVVVDDGDSGTAIGETLTDAGVVKTVEAFTNAYSANPNATSIQAGTYELQEGMRSVDAVAALLDPASRIDLRLTVPEGWTVAQIYGKMADLLMVPVEDVEAAAEKLAASALPESAGGELEGWLFPSTYTLSPDDTPASVLERMLDKMISELDAREVPEKEREALLIKASIVEKEGTEQYWGKIARVVENRLEGCSGDGRLGMDATYVYRLGKKANDITSEEWRKDDPYNGREGPPGLPPTPIGAPGTGAIDAVLDPPAGDWCYFVSVNLETQETKFTDDLKQHLKNQEEYRQWLREQTSAPTETGE